MLYDAAVNDHHDYTGLCAHCWLPLALIQLVWTFVPLVAVKQADFGEIVGELIRFFHGYRLSTRSLSIPFLGRQPL